MARRRRSKKMTKKEMKAWATLFPLIVVMGVLGLVLKFVEENWKPLLIASALGGGIYFFMHLRKKKRTAASSPVSMTMTGVTHDYNQDEPPSKKQA